MIVVGQRTRRGKRSDLVLTALARLLQAREVDRNYSLCGEPDLYIQWGFRLTPALRCAIEHLVPFAIVDLGVFQDRNECISISFNGFHGLSLPVQDLPEPARRHPELLPYNPQRGGMIYVLGQVPDDRALRGADGEVWAAKTARELAEGIGLPVTIRPHPATVKYRLPPLASLADTAYAVVAWTTSAAVETTRLGLPTVTYHPANLAWPVASHTVDFDFPPPQDDRAPWIHRLSHMNYKVTELDEAAKYIRHALPQALASASRDLYDTEGLRP